MIRTIEYSLKQTHVDLETIRRNSSEIAESVKFLNELPEGQTEDLIIYGDAYFALPGFYIQVESIIPKNPNINELYRARIKITGNPQEEPSVLPILERLVGSKLTKVKTN